MSEGPLEIVKPAHWPPPAGFSYATTREEGRVVVLAGQLGGPTGEAASALGAGMAEQFLKALENVVTVLVAAGGKPQELTALRVFVTDIRTFRTARPLIASGWRRLLGKHFPAMTLVEVSALYEATALVEIEAVALLGKEVG